MLFGLYIEQSLFPSRLWIIFLSFILDQHSFSFMFYFWFYDSPWLTFLVIEGWVCLFVFSRCLSSHSRACSYLPLNCLSDSSKCLCRELPWYVSWCQNNGLGVVGRLFRRWLQLSDSDSGQGSDQGSARGNRETRKYHCLPRLMATHCSTPACPPLLPTYCFSTQRMTANYVGNSWTVLGVKDFKSGSATKS